MQTKREELKDAVTGNTLASAVMIDEQIATS
jgi:hypothetical protein